MAVPWRKNPNTSLECQPWRKLSVEGKILLVKGVFLASSYSILCTDSSLMWEEILDEENLLERSKSLNSHIEAPPTVITQQLLQRLLNGPLIKCKYSINITESLLTLSVSGPLQGDSGPEYQWNFCLHKTPSLVLKHQLVNPLLSMSVELLRQRNRLVDIIEKKDKEIRDYKENGAVISRKHLETLPFDEKAFTNEMIVTQDFQVSSIDPLSSIDLSWQDLYRDLSLCRNWVSSTDVTSSTAEMLPGTGGTWENKLPPSLVGSATTTPSVSPKKRSLESSPSKDAEKMRRLELERQLENSKAKNKKKKKKLM